jgi:hypothetical protein
MPPGLRLTSRRSRRVRGGLRLATQGIERQPPTAVAEPTTFCTLFTAARVALVRSRSQSKSSRPLSQAAASRYVRVNGRGPVADPVGGEAMRAGVHGSMLQVGRTASGFLIQADPGFTGAIG